MAFDPWVYDQNKDCYISTAEKDQAIADWQRCSWTCHFRNNGNSWNCCIRISMLFYI